MSAAAASAFSVAAAVTGLGCLMLSLDPGQAVAVCGPALGDWTFDAWITAPLALSATLYGIGAARLALRSPRGLSRSAETLAFVAGWLALALALVSPLHRVGERLFTAHMIEHEIVMAVAAPLIVLARPAAALLIMGAFLGRDYCLSPIGLCMVADAVALPVFPPSCFRLFLRAPWPHRKAPGTVYGAERGEARARRQ